MLFRPIIWLSLLATILVTSIDPAFAQIPDNALDDILDQFKQNLPAGRVVKNYAQTLFYSLLLIEFVYTCLLYTSPSPRDGLLSRMPSSA